MRDLIQFTGSVFVMLVVYWVGFRQGRRSSSRTGRNVPRRPLARLADALMPWVAANATVWPSQHATHQVLMDARRAERSRAQYLVGRLDDALRDVDPEYVNSPLEMDEVRPFLADGPDDHFREVGSQTDERTS